MSKNNNFNQSNNERYYNNNRGGRRNSFNNRNKNDRQPKTNPNVIKMPLYLQNSIPEDIANEILSILATNKFNKISIPLSTYRFTFEETNEGDNRVYTIGYIRNYNAETCEFTVVVFDGFLDAIKSLGNVGINPMYTTYNNALGTITKFIAVPVVLAENESTDDEVDDDYDKVDDADEIDMVNVTISPEQSEPTVQPE